MNMVKDRQPSNRHWQLMYFLQRTWSYSPNACSLSTCYTNNKIALLVNEMMVTEHLRPLKCFHEVLSYCSKNLLFLAGRGLVLLMDLKFDNIPCLFYFWVRIRGQGYFFLSACSGRALLGALQWRTLACLTAKVKIALSALSVACSCRQIHRDFFLRFSVLNPWDLWS